MVLISLTSFELLLCNSYFGRNLEFLYFKNGLLNQVFDLIALLVRVCVCVYMCVYIYKHLSNMYISSVYVQVFCTHVVKYPYRCMHILYHIVNVPMSLTVLACCEGRQNR